MVALNNDVRSEQNQNRPDAVKLQGTITALRPFMTEARAKETEIILKRMFDRARRWNDRPSS